MAFVIYAIAWFAILMIHLAAGGDFKDDSPLKYLGWLCIGVVFLCAIYTMVAASFMAGVGMIGSLAFFAVRKNKE
ncbi:MAG: hypothetical protein AB8I69_21410 [Anaerolineae bacterium]